MTKRNWFSRILSSFIALAMLAPSLPAQAEPLSPAYEKGIDPTSPMGKELIDILASYPNMAKVSYEITGEQKFRVPFGPTFWRMLLQPNTLKVLFIGQDGTHVAEAAGRTATAGFGGRAQDLASYFGVRESAGFINAFGPTIYGQYGAFDAPIFSNDGASVRTGSVVDNHLWLMSQDAESPLVQWRARLIDWIIRNNRDSLKLVVLFGGAARDTIGSFVEMKGGKVGARVKAEDLAGLKVPMTKIESAGSNHVFPVLVDKNGKDLYAKYAGRRLDYSKPEDQKEALDLLKKNAKAIYAEAALVNGGLQGSGIVHPAQLGGYDLRKMDAAGTGASISLKGLPLGDGTKVAHDILVVQSPHPTALSMMGASEASKVVGQALEPLDAYVKKGWKIQPDAGQESGFLKGEAYKYRRTDIPTDYYDFGTPKNRMVSRSDASRMSSNVIVIGTRDRASFDKGAIAAITKQPVPAGLSQAELFVTRPRSLEKRYQFDAGPGDEFAKLMKENLDMDVIGKPKPGKKFETDGIAAFNIKTHPENVGDFGHYRGTFNKARVVVLADPDGLDDMLTSRALTGTRGQYLQTLLESMGVGEQSLIFKTVPFGMDGATASEWAEVLKQTENYRSRVLAKVLSVNKVELVIADGPHAAAEAARVLKGTGVKVVTIDRKGTENSSGIAEAAKEIASKFPQFKSASFGGQMTNIPRSHLTMLARTWEGTGGSHVLDSTAPKYRGLAFAVVAPEWAYRQQLPLTAVEQKSVAAIKKRLSDLGLPAPGQDARDFFKAGVSRSAMMSSDAANVRVSALRVAGGGSCEVVFKK